MAEVGAGALRVVPACPELVEVLRAEVAWRGLRPEAMMFTREDGRPLSGALYRRTWRQAREAVLEAHEIAFSGSDPALSPLSTAPQKRSRPAT